MSSAASSDQYCQGLTPKSRKAVDEGVRYEKSAPKSPSVRNPSKKKPPFLRNTRVNACTGPCGLIHTVMFVAQVQIVTPKAAQAQSEILPTS